MVLQNGQNKHQRGCFVLHYLKATVDLIYMEMKGWGEKYKDVCNLHADESDTLFFFSFFKTSKTFWGTLQIMKWEQPNVSSIGNKQIADKHVSETLFWCYLRPSICTVVTNSKSSGVTNDDLTPCTRWGDIHFLVWIWNLFFFSPRVHCSCSRIYRDHMRGITCFKRLFSS